MTEAPLRNSGHGMPILSSSIKTRSFNSSLLQPILVSRDWSVWRVRVHGAR
ncbi:hypothetical protein NC653_001470 [Populus alba x Populus x berolinensis]|uniref:Uncharacterized protein n=1 Tax=Populus alba x Populus x berolinensis TaxID=444605 RepID=A0AAD6WG25_9ROSI|nr:hypothetical protein NC653_001470 [Populus alba x Populus x berolinensis]